MYNNYNASKSNQSQYKKRQGPNADQVKSGMAPGAYQQKNQYGLSPSMVKPVPDWMAAVSPVKPQVAYPSAPPAAPMTSGYGDAATAYYKGLGEKPYNDQQEYLAKVAARDAALAANPPATPNSAYPTRQSAGGTLPQAPQNIAPPVGGTPLQPSGGGLGVPSNTPRTGLEGVYGYIPPAGVAKDVAMENEYDYRRRVRDHNTANGMPELGTQPTDVGAYQSQSAAPTPGQVRAPQDLPPGSGVPGQHAIPQGVNPATANAYGLQGDPLAAYGSGAQSMNSLQPQAPHGGGVMGGQSGQIDSAMNQEAQHAAIRDTRAQGNAPWYGGIPSIPDNRELSQIMANPDSMLQRAYGAAKEQTRAQQRQELSGASMDQLNQYAADAGMPVNGPDMPQEQIDAMNAATDARLASTNDLMAKTAQERADIQAGYAPRTKALRLEANNIANRTDRAEAAMRGELGPRAPGADISGPYYRDSTGRPYDNRVNSTYSASEAAKERDNAMAAQGKDYWDAHKQSLAATDEKLKNRDSKPILDPKQMRVDANQFSTDYLLYKKGGGQLSPRDYIMQQAAQNKLSPDLTRQLEHNYNMDLSSAAVQGVKLEDTASQRGNAMTAAADKRATKEARNQKLIDARVADSSQRWLLDKQVGADAAMGYGNTRPGREAQQAQQAYVTQGLAADQKARDDALASQKDLIKAKADADAAVYQREVDARDRAEYQQWSDQTRAQLQSQYSGPAFDAAWAEAQRNYSGRIPPAQSAGGVQQPAATGTPGGVSPAQKPKLSLGEFQKDIQDNRIPINPDASQLDQMASIAKAGSEHGLSVDDTAKAIASHPGGADLSQPVEARKYLSDITAAMSDHGRHLTAGGDGVNDVPADRYYAGRLEILEQNKDLLKVIAKTIGKDEVEKQLNSLGWFDTMFYAGSTDSRAKLDKIMRGIFGG